MSAARGLYPDDLVLELDRHLADALEVETDPNKQSQIRRAAEWVRDGANRTAIEIIAKVIAELVARQAGMERRGSVRGGRPQSDRGNCNPNCHLRTM